MNRNIFYITICFLIFVIGAGIVSKVTSIFEPTGVFGKTNVRLEIPFRNTKVSEPIVSAESAYSVLIKANGTEHVLYSKNADTRTAIASVTKLATGAAIVDKLSPRDTITISQKAVEQFEKAGQLAVGEVYTRNELLYPLLVESSNDAAYAFGEKIGMSELISGMNKIAEQAGATSTRYINASGLDGVPSNSSTARDVAKVAYYVYKKYPDVMSLTRIPGHTLTTNTGVKKTLRSTNTLLTDTSFPFTILGGKTGETPQAKQALVLITTSPTSQSVIVTVVLRSHDRATDMRTILNWIKTGYVWTQEEAQELLKAQTATDDRPLGTATRRLRPSLVPKITKVEAPKVDPLITLEWIKATTTIPWQARDAHTTVAFNNKMYLIGGVIGNGIVTANGVVEYWNAPHASDIWSTYDGFNWTKETDIAPWRNRRSMTAIVFQGKLWNMGGWSQYDYKYDNRIWWSDDGIKWNLATSTDATGALLPRWEGREGHTLNVYNGKLYLMGGVNFTKRITYNDVWESADGYTWKKISSENGAPWSPRYDHAVAVFDNKLYLTGGLHINTHVTESEVWVSTDGIVWEKRTPEWPSRHGHISENWNGALWIIGGWHEGQGAENRGINDTWFTRDGIRWTKTINDGPWLGREDHMGTVFNNMMWVTGGMDTNEYWSNDVYFGRIKGQNKP